MDSNPSSSASDPTQSQSSRPSINPRKPSSEIFIFGASPSPARTPFSRDMALPSIERDGEASSIIGSLSSPAVHFRAPSFSISLPPSVEHGGTTTSSPSPSARILTPNSTGDSLTERTRNLTLGGPATPSPFPPQENTISSPRRILPVSSRQSSPASPSQQARFTFTSSIAHEIQNLGIGSSSSSRNSPVPIPTPPRHLLSPQSVSPDSTRRRRSGSRRRSNAQVNEEPYRVEDEQPPDAPFHHPDFQRGYHQAKNLVSDLTSVLRQSSLHTEPASPFAGHYERAQTLSGFECPAKRTVGLVGVSGVGKSSLLNALLDVNGLAKTGGSGACTCVVTEFHYHNRNDFVAVVDYFNEAEITDHFRELLNGYRRYYLHRDEDSKDDAVLARDTFLAAFEPHLRQSEALLLEVDMETALNTLLLWAKKLDTPLRDGDINARRRYESPTPKECSMQLKKFISSSNPDRGVVWPFIRKISIYLKAYILSQGLVLADLPGLKDTNSARVKITETYVRSCDEIFAICEIRRAVSDQGVQDVLQLAKRANVRNTGIICTQSEVIYEDEAACDLRGGDAATLKRLMEERHEVANQIGDIKQDLKDIEGKPNGISVGDVPELNQLNTEKKSLEAEKERLELKLKSHLMVTRNLDVKGKLATQQHEEFPSIEQKVFCVSSKDYWTYRGKSREKAQPYMDLSGIPMVRRHCISIVAQSQLRAAKEFMEKEIPVLLGSIKIWVQSGTQKIGAERRATIRNMLDEVDRELQEKLSMPGSSLRKTSQLMKQEFKEHISEIMRNQSPLWSSAAGKASMDWNGWHFSTYTAFCRNYGDHSTGAVPYRRCWNDEAMAVMVARMDSPWDMLRQRLTSLNNQSGELIREAMDGVIQSLSTNADIPSETVETLIVTLQHRHNLLLDEVDQTHELFEEKLRHIETATFTGIRTSIIGELMKESYEKCKNELGTGSDARRKHIINTRFGDHACGLFMELHRCCRDKFSQWAEELENRVQEVIISHLEAVQTVLSMLRDGHAALEGDRDPEFRGRVDDEVERIRREMERINEQLNAFLVI
ncbi:hypothetical protein P152DRAFT_459457 [Eremomyces bilateralis CBS 781.70]|uniref:P-loop containing nucleoside triphosphate hydrolase protein n=1 Tax=Eremomyces bilateralis CBS 781.70 TaxID=1392243 RepID=A0A6G1G077_9PEZI|nr:uncharacterized protein P152DRAFT_459457 [Eremomyces bilateralis CBS 781.70]KAF1811517.1 hypothetical protein P152DRAFT_459457 [Eremomyces bilateralis CBS 781.70]